MLCARFGQNERSLFNYLTGHEPFSFHSFLFLEKINEKQPKLLKICDLYDYFIEFAGFLRVVKNNCFFLFELRDRIRANLHLDWHLTDILKTIAVLNALFAGGLKASNETIILAMVNQPGENTREIEKSLSELVFFTSHNYAPQTNQ